MRRAQLSSSESSRTCDKNDTVLDFAGSATTGHAVMNVNATDGGSRRCILVQLGEAPKGKIRRS